MKNFQIYQDSSGSENTNGIAFSTDVFIRDILATIEETITVPTGARFAVFQSDVAKLWVGVGSTPITVPTGDSDSNTIALNPDIRYLGLNKTIRIISPSAGQIVVSFYG